MRRIPERAGERWLRGKDFLSTGLPCEFPLRMSAIVKSNQNASKLVLEGVKELSKLMLPEYRSILEPDGVQHRK